MKFSLIVPMYNEAEVIQDTARTLVRELDPMVEDYEILFVDDGSRDSCADLVRELNLPRVRVEGYPQNHGKGYAVKTGMLAAGGDVRMFLDADLAYGTQVVGQALALFEEHPDKDVIIGSRALHPEGYEGYTPLRKLASKVYLKVLCRFGGFQLSDSQCGCKAFRAAAAEAIFSRCETEGFAFDFEVILLAQKLGCRVLEMPVKIVNHRFSKVNLVKDTLNMLKEISRIKKRVKKTPTQ